jgi:hypothetical protein
MAYRGMGQRRLGVVPFEDFDATLPARGALPSRRRFRGGVWVMEIFNHAASPGG